MHCHPRRRLPLRRCNVSHAKILNLKAMVHAPDGAVIPATSVEPFLDMDRALVAANELHSQAQADAQALLKQARLEGFEQGCQEARAQMAQEIAQQQRRAHELYEKQTAMVQDLALAIVERLMPQLDAVALIQPMVTRAILAAQADQYLQVKVHPAQLDAAHAAIATLGNVHPAVGVYQVIADDTLDELSCVVETEVGAVRANFAQQIDAIRAALNAPDDDEL